MSEMHHGRLEVKAGKGRKIVGYASTWDLDSVGDVIQPGAYARTLAELKESGRKLPLLDNHRYQSTDSALGVMVDAEETVKGLRSEFEIVDDPKGDLLLKQVEIGAISSFSIGYETRAHREPTKDERKMGVRRVLEDVELREVSAVIFPANTYAIIEGIKSGNVLDAIKTAMSDLPQGDVRSIASHAGSLLNPNRGNPTPVAASAKGNEPDDAAIRRAELLRELTLREFRSSYRRK